MTNKNKKCIVCKEPGEQKGGKWSYTVCDNCFKESKKFKEE